CSRTRRRRSHRWNRTARWRAARARGQSPSGCPRQRTRRRRRAVPRPKQRVSFLAFRSRSLYVHAPFMARVALVTLLVLALLAPPAHATPPGANGKIAFSIFGDIYTVEPDGSGLRQIVRPGAEDGKLDWYPAWSPDGTMLATYGNETERDQWGTVMNIW